jgi:hypothetical protein
MKPKESASEAGMQSAASEWTKSWRIISSSLKEMGVSDVDHNARAIIARLAAQNMLIVSVDNVKDGVKRQETCFDCGEKFDVSTGICDHCHEERDRIDETEKAIG